MKRESNLELLRIISMIMIITLHLLNFGGFLNKFDYKTLEYNITWFLEALCFVAVNCYVLISGYFLVKSKFSLKRILRVWIEVIFYSTIIYIIMLIFGKANFTFDELIKNFLPIISSLYWFASLYVLLCFIFPFLNLIINKLNKKQYEYLLIFNFIVFSILPTIFFKHYGINFGGSYSIAWFINLYFIAGYLKLHFDIKKYCLKTYIGIYFLLSFLLMAANFIFLIISKGRYSANFMYNYYSFTVVLASIALFCFFKNLKINNKTINKLVTFLSPLTFGVYLIHENHYIRSLIWNNIPKIYNNLVIYLIYIIIAVITIYIVCSFVEFLIIKIINLLTSKIFNSKKFKKLNDKCNKIVGEIV